MTGETVFVVLLIVSPLGWILAGIIFEGIVEVIKALKEK